VMTSGVSGWHTPPRAFEVSKRSHTSRSRLPRLDRLHAQSARGIPRASAALRAHRASSGRPRQSQWASSCAKTIAASAAAAPRLPRRRDSGRSWT
jgi:hypothetical protein